MNWLSAIISALAGVLGGAAGAGIGEGVGGLAGGAAEIGTEGAGAGLNLGLSGADIAGGAGVLGSLGNLGLGLAQNQMQPGMPSPEPALPPNLQGQGNPAALRQRTQGASADLQARGLDVGAAPDFLQKQLESDLGLTPDEFQRIFRLGGGSGAAGGV
jgi:hypothetical protein